MERPQDFDGLSKGAVELSPCVQLAAVSDGRRVVASQSRPSSGRRGQEMLWNSSLRYSLFLSLLEAEEGNVGTTSYFLIHADDADILIFRLKAAGHTLGALVKGEYDRETLIASLLELIGNS
jgi:hypothetical protein